MNIKVGEKAPFFEKEATNGEMCKINGNIKSYTLLTFFRHAGCPMCNLRTRLMINNYEEFEKHGIDIVTVFESSKESILRDVGKQNPPFPIISDPSRVLYKLYGVTPSLFGMMKIFFTKPNHVYEAIFKNGFIPNFSEATPMMPADFLIDSDGIVKVAYYGKDIGDHIDLDTLFSLVKEQN